jgi:phage shock protein PspC (stress-responsive transcriptional regulator)
MTAKLYRSRTDHMLAGVCGGLGEYLGIDSTLVRLFFVLLALPGAGIGFALYIILWVILPYAGEGTIGSTGTVMNGSTEIAGRARAMGDDLRNVTPNAQAGLIIGIALVVLGAFYLVDQLHLPFLFWLRPGLLWPILLIIAGVALVWRRLQENK